MKLCEYFETKIYYRLKPCNESGVDDENMYLVEYEGYGHQQWLSFWVQDKKYPDIKFEPIDLGSTLELNKHAMGLVPNSVRMVAESDDQMLVSITHAAFAHNLYTDTNYSFHIPL